MQDERSPLQMSQKSQPTPDLMEAIRRAEVEAREHGPRRRTSPPTAERLRAAQELMEWLESDALDWDALERAHAHRA